MSYHRVATRRGSTIQHVVAGVRDWYPGMYATTECGIKNADVQEQEAKDSAATLCKRCARTLGGDLRPGYKETQRRLSERF